jgi:hypothetical protein
MGSQLLVHYMVEGMRGLKKQPADKCNVQLGLRGSSIRRLGVCQCQTRCLNLLTSVFRNPSGLSNILTSAHYIPKEGR